MESFVTLLNSTYIPQGLALYISMERNISEFRLWFICMDQDCFVFLSSLELPNAKCLNFADLETEELKNVKSERKLNEYFWTVTPYTIRFVFEKDQQINRITYVDADLWFMKNPIPIFEEFKQSGKSVLITRHAYSPENDLSMITGKFCVQFIIFDRSDGEKVRKWWEKKCIEWCYDRFEDNKFGDQKYLDIWPVMFENEVHILSHQELTLAPWNATRFPYSDAIFFHFHGLKIISSNHDYLALLMLLNYH